MKNMIDKIPDDAFIRLNQIVGDAKTNTPPLIPVSKATIWNWVKDPHNPFPSPVKLSDSVTVWKVGDIRMYIDTRGANDERI